MLGDGASRSAFCSLMGTIELCQREVVEPSAANSRRLNRRSAAWNACAHFRFRVALQNRRAS
jgi:hypothetical protein